jgi:hypothetical protein
MIEKEISLSPSNKLKTWRLGFAWGTLACFSAALLIFVFSQKSGNMGMLYLILGSLGLGFLCGVMVVILNGKEKESIGAAPHKAEFGLAMGITLIIFIVMIIFAFLMFFAAVRGLR